MPDGGQVRLVSASNLMAKDRGGTSDPFAILELAGTKHRSQTIMKTLNPTWNEAFAFKGVLGTLIQKPLSVKCYDYDKMAMNDALGELSFSLEPLRGKHELAGTDCPLAKAPPPCHPGRTPSRSSTTPPSASLPRADAPRRPRRRRAAPSPSSSSGSPTSPRAAAARPRRRRG